jgi:hypothetical protein
MKRRGDGGANHLAMGEPTTFHFRKSKTEKILRKAIAKGFLNI